MGTAKQEIVDFVKVLVKHPESVRVTEKAGPPVTFEIMVHKEDLAEARSKEIAIKAICPVPKCRFKFVEE